MVTEKTEKRTFGMHPNLLFDVIMRQAGTIQKALLEGIMNAVDAGATECHVTLDSHTFTIQDNGRGIQTRQEIEDFFETFGTPHQEGDAVYGRFRMGRGQMMAYGRNIWRSRTFEMDVDIKKSGLDYTLTEHAEDFQGTRITAELYDPIAPSDLERTKGELRKFVAWTPIPIILNGETISKSVVEGKWSYEDEDAYYTLSADRQHMAVYNQGVLVNHFHAGRFGMGGTVVTKHKIDVNFARNDIQSSCPIFKRIQAYIKKQSGMGAAKKTKLTEAERDMLAQELLAGTADFKTALKLRVLTDVHGRAWPLDKLAQIPNQFSGKLLLGERGDKIAESAQNRGMAFTIDEATLERFNASDEAGFIARIKHALYSLMGNTRSHPTHAHSLENYRMQSLCRTLDTITIAQHADMRAVLNDGYIGMEKKDLTVDQKILLAALSAASYPLVSAMNAMGYEDLRFSPRRLHLGTSDVALAWTDGTDNIWVNIEHARLLRRGYAGAYQVALTLLHEMLHTGPNTGTHQHDLAFYQAFHDLSGASSDPVGQAAARMMAVFMAQLRQQGRKISSKLLERDDADQALINAQKAAEHNEAAA